VLAVIGGVGFYVFNANKDVKKSTEISQTTPIREESQNSDENYIEFKEIGVKIEKSENLMDISYKTMEYNGIIVVEISSAAVTEMHKACYHKLNDSLAVAGVFRYEGTYKASEQKLDSEEIFLKQFNNFYLLGIEDTTNGYCLENKPQKIEVDSLAAKIQMEINEAFKYAEEIKN